jgi:hypothetical protein
MRWVLEEVVLAINAKKPVFLLGAFGGVTGDVCEAIQNGNLPERLTEDWQILHNEGYSDLQKLARSKGFECNYKLISNTVRNTDILELSKRAGLSKSDYKRLMISPFIDECVYLILKGLKCIANSTCD